MKISITLAILILAAFAAIAYKDRQMLSQVRKSHSEAVAEAAALGISIDPGNPEAAALVTKRTREDKEAAAKEVARELIAFAVEMKAFEEKGEQPDEAMQKRTTDFMELMLSLDSSQIKILIAEFRASTEMDEETRTGMVVFAIMTLAADHPEAALSIFTESGDAMEDGMMSRHLLSSSLANWASRDPDAALEWVRKNGKKHPDLITDEIKAGLVKGAAVKDMKLGFDLMTELKLEDASTALYGLAQSARTAEQRTEFLKLFRTFSEGRDDSKTGSAISVLADGIVKDGFEEGSKWIAANKLTPEEMQTMASMIGYTAKSEERGKWISWMGESLPEKSRDTQIQGTVSHWTGEDYRAAGEWLAAEPEGATKRSAVKAYAETVGEYDPATAAQWAMTLPEGEERQETFQAIHSKMPDKTPAEKAARKAFKEQHGIE